MGRQTVSLLLVFGYILSLWRYTESLFPPAIVLAMFVGLLVYPLPAPLSATLTLIVVTALAITYYNIVGRAI